MTSTNIKLILGYGGLRNPTYFTFRAKIFCVCGRPVYARLPLPVRWTPTLDPFVVTVVATAEGGKEVCCCCWGDSPPEGENCSELCSESGSTWSPTICPSPSWLRKSQLECRWVGSLHSLGSHPSTSLSYPVAWYHAQYHTQRPTL